jgi:hypothetical protein
MHFSRWTVRTRLIVSGLQTPSLYGSVTMLLGGEGRLKRFVRSQLRATPTPERPQASENRREGMQDRRHLGAWRAHRLYSG